jgi:hypothetical protein
MRVPSGDQASGPTPSVGRISRSPSGARMRIPWYGLPIVAHAPAHSAAKAKRVPSGDQLAPPISVQEPPHLTTHAPMPSVPIARDAVD